MAASTPIPLSAKAQKAFIEFYNSTQDFSSITKDEIRQRLAATDRQYQRELDRTEEHLRAQAANKAGDTSRFQNVTIPVVMPQVEAAVVYQSSVFLTGSPIFGVVAAPAFMDAALQMETKIDNDATKGGWTRELMMFFRDGFKYNYAPVEVSWKAEVTNTVETDITISTTEGVPKEVLWTGNELKRLDPYNTFLDTRVPASEVYRSGEFAGFTEYKSRIQLKQFIAELPDKLIANIKLAFESGSSAAPASTDASSRDYYIPSINATVNEDDYAAEGTNWLRWAGLSSTKDQKIEYKDGYQLTTLYCKVLPSEFDLRIPNSNTPQIYKLYIVNHQVIIYAERQTNAHGYIPIFVGAPLEDGLDYQTKSLAENAAPFQEVASAYMNSIMASRRRAINDRLLYDPSRVTSNHINSANPSAKIPVRPAAYGKAISDAVYQFPYREDTSASGMAQIQALLGLSNQLAGQNQAQQGQFVKGNKTLQEFDSVMQNANGRDQLASILIEAQVFVPLKHVLKLNVMQYQGGTTLYNKDKNVEVEIDPIALRKAVLDFKVSDGIIPNSKIINSDAFAVALQVFGSSPQIASGYNVAPMFSDMMKTQGAKISDFEKPQEQVAYEQAMQQWQQIAMAAIDKGQDISQLPPQPLPENYGFDPKAMNPTSTDTTGNTSGASSPAEAPALPQPQG